MDTAQHRLLYREKYGVDEFDLDSELAPIPISPSMSEAEVYRMLPTAPDFEYGGFITESFIRYQKCEATLASTVTSEACTWHSHPTNSPMADMPSCSDIYTFLTECTLRAVTTANHKIWVFDKSERTLPSITKLREWEEVNFMQEVHKAVLEQNCIQRYHDVAMASLGFSITDRAWYSDNWVDVVESLGITVRLFDRTDNGS